MRISPDEWRDLFSLRDDLIDDDDRRLLRRFIKYVEYLERKLGLKPLSEKGEG